MPDTPFGRGRVDAVFNGDSDSSFAVSDRSGRNNAIGSAAEDIREPAVSVSRIKRGQIVPAMALQCVMKTKICGFFDKQPLGHMAYNSLHSLYRQISIFSKPNPAAARLSSNFYADVGLEKKLNTSAIWLFL